jgi:hypothetical protein
MKQLGHSLIVAAVGLGLVAVACSSTKDGGVTPPTTTDGGADAATGTDGGSSGDSSTPPVKPPASTTEGDVSFEAACPAFTPCGGALEGTYDFTGGCAGDVFAQIKANCPAIDFSGASVTIAGSLYFIGNEVSRAVTAKVSGTIVVPAACAQPIGGCASLQTALASSFDTITCTEGAANACSCDIARSDVDASQSTFTISGNTATTADGQSYDFCVDGDDMTYTGKAASAEGGVWELTKR